MGKIITLRDNITQEAAYPITKIDAVINEDGTNFKESLENKILDITLLLNDAVSRAETAANSVISLSNLTDTDTVLEELEKLSKQVESSRKDILNLTNKYNELLDQLQYTISNSSIVSEVIGEAGKIPNSMAVRNYVTNRTNSILNRLIDTTTVEPNFSPKGGGQILINTSIGNAEGLGIVYISAGDNSWLRLRASVFELPESVITKQIENISVLSLDGDVNIDETNNTVEFPNEGNVEDDTLIL